MTGVDLNSCHYEKWPMTYDMIGQFFYTTDLELAGHKNALLWWCFTLRTFNEEDCDCIVYYVLHWVKEGLHKQYFGVLEFHIISIMYTRSVTKKG